MSAKTCPGCGEVSHHPDGACSGHPTPAVPVGVPAKLACDCGGPKAIGMHYSNCASLDPRPVGVQPEPAEGPTCPATGHRCHLDCPADEPPGLCPAVPVVHPEPGDRPDLTPTINDWCLSLPFRSGEDTGWHYIDTQALVRLNDALDARVAAVVAVVRAEQKAHIANLEGRVRNLTAQNKTLRRDLRERDS